MKNILVLFATLVYFYGASQDLIILKTGDEIKSKVIKVGLSEIEYKKDSTSPMYAIKKSEVFIIKYENGTKDVFVNNESNVRTLSSVEQSKEEEIEKKQSIKRTKKPWPKFQYDSVKLNCYETIFELGGVFGAGYIPASKANYYVQALDPYSYSYPINSLYYKSRHGTIKNYQNLFCLRVITGKRIKGGHFIGMGLELDVTSKVGDFRSMYFPFFVEYRNTFTKRRITPLFLQDIGGSFFLPTINGGYALHHAAGGILTNTSLGVNVHINPKISCHFTLGYRFQHITFHEGSYYTYNSSTNLYRSVSSNLYLHYAEHFVTMVVGLSF